MAIVVVVDSNIISDSPSLRREEWLSLIKNQAAWGVEFAIPEVVVMESVNVVKREWNKQRDSLAKAKVGEFGLGDTLNSMLTEIDRRSEGYEQSLRDRLGEIGASIVAPPPADLMDLARRAAVQRAPYRKDKDGFRDTLIWLTALDIAQKRSDAEVWFVSDNHEDFGPKPGSWTGENTGERDDCPILFHQDLREDLDGRGLLGRVNYVVSLKRLEQHIAARFAPIPESELRTRADRIDRDSLAERLMSAAHGVDVDPEQVALPLAAAAAAITGTQGQHGGWEFSEGALRADAGWTARFAVNVEVDISFVRTDLTTGEITKTLRVFGDITVSLGNEVVDIAVTSAEALPDDPMRARWARRSAERASNTKFPDPFWDRPLGTVSAPYANAQNRAFAEQIIRSESLQRIAEQAQKPLPPEDLQRMAENAWKTLPPEFR
ncbi:PIN domain-containing protein [Nocardia sp. NPDC052001]|uniref:PIN domain-containing protein n=1 Tax=Nocardia sp. NPDC052001 TaxID=3154853 RepID=UPI0034499C2D